MAKEVYRPARGAPVSIHVDLQDLCKKAIARGPLLVLGETVLNLCLMANDHFKLMRGRHGDQGGKPDERTSDKDKNVSA